MHVRVFHRHPVYDLLPLWRHHNPLLRSDQPEMFIQSEQLNPKRARALDFT